MLRQSSNEVGKIGADGKIVADEPAVADESAVEGGYIVIETLFSFTMLVMVMVVIISLINIVAIKSRIHYAITQTAQEISMYAYVTTRLSEDEEKYESGYNDGFEWVESAQGALDTLSSGITSVSNNIAAGITGFFIDDYAAELMRELATAPSKDARQLIMEDAVKDVFAKYLSDDITRANAQADEYLIRSGVRGSDGSIKGLAAIAFANSAGVSSTMIDSKGDTVVAIAYKIEFNLFNVIPLPLYLDVEQTARTKAWLGGRTQK